MRKFEPEKVTPRQGEILAFVRANIQRRYPTVRQIAKHFGVAPSTVQQHLDALRKKGALI